MSLYISDSGTRQTCQGPSLQHLGCLNLTAERHFAHRARRAGYVQVEWFAVVDVIVSGGGSTVSWIDRWMCRWASTSQFFTGGWGDPGELDELTARITSQPDAEPLEITLEEVRPGWIRGRFRSTEAGAHLPEVVQRGGFELLLPPEDLRGPVCMHLAGTGEAATLPRRLLGVPLLRRGIGALAVQHPYYGVRAPEGQPGTRVRTVTEYLWMMYLAVQEGRALLRWLRDQGHPQIGVSGFSQGGFLATAIGALEDHPVAIVPLGAGLSPSQGLIDGPLGTAIAWDALGGAEGKERYRELVEQLSARHHPRPNRLDATILLGAEDDVIISPDNVQALADHWEGAELRWLPGGHFQARVASERDIRQAIEDAFRRLGAPEPPESPEPDAV